jgi:hypothetical protein
MPGGTGSGPGSPFADFTRNQYEVPTVLRWDKHIEITRAARIHLDQGGGKTD